MPIVALKPSAHLSVQRVSSPDEFKTIGFLEIERQVLLGPFAYGRAITALPGMLLMLEKTSTRRLSAMMNAMDCTVIVPMADNADALFNTRVWRSCEVGLLRGETSFDLLESSSNKLAVIRFASDMRNRGWEEAEGQLHLRGANGEYLRRLQGAISHAFMLASLMGHREFTSAAEALRNEILDALDLVLVSGNARRPGVGSFERHRRLVSRLDELVESHPDMPLYSEALARELGTSIRTLQFAVNAVHGSSLHQYLRNKRLWSLRALLAKGMPTTSVSSASLANGFLHMGELSRLYKVTFGELPSQTLLRSKGG